MNANIKDYNIKWLEYMNNVDVNIVKICPNGHALLAYVSHKQTELIICCPQANCKYYDYNTFKVSMNTKLLMEKRI